MGHLYPDRAPTGRRYRSSADLGSPADGGEGLGVVLLGGELGREVLRATPSPSLSPRRVKPGPRRRARVEQSVIYTTSSWCYRVANAAHRGTGDGTLSRRLSQLPDDFRRERIDNLPDWVGLLGPRLVVPVMASIITRRRPKPN